jgi:hypothetical protein
MKKILLLAVVLVCALQMNVLGQMGGRNFGLGLEFGDYPGVIAKIWVTDINAFSAGVGFGPFTRMHVDYLWHDFSVIKVNEGRLPLYYGFGGILNTGTYNYQNFGVRGTFGLSYIFRENRFDIFLEVSPTFRFNPENGLFISGSVGARYYF